MIDQMSDNLIYFQICINKTIYTFTVQESKFQSLDLIAERIFTDPLNIFEINAVKYYHYTLEIIKQMIGPQWQTYYYFKTNKSNKSKKRSRNE